MALGNKKLLIEDSKNAVDYSGYIGQQKIFKISVVEDSKKRITEINNYLANGWKVIYIESQADGQLFILEYSGINE